MLNCFPGPICKYQILKLILSVTLVVAVCFLSLRWMWKNHHVLQNLILFSSKFHLCSTVLTSARMNVPLVKICHLTPGDCLTSHLRALCLVQS